MKALKLNLLVTVLAVVAVAHGHVAIKKTPNELHPVHELYVKPSADGTTGDLYVAATEENGAKTQWLTDQPVHFLPAQTPAATTNYEETLAPKHAVANPHLHYAYAMPVAGNPESNAIPSYPYALPAASPTPATEAKTDAPPAALAYPQYNPYHFFYPQMMAAYANMMSVLKDSGMSEESANSAMSHGTSAWPHTYGYPFQYVMVDPSAWAQAQPTAAPAAAAAAVPSTPATSDKE